MHIHTNKHTHAQAEAKARLLEEYQAARGRCTSTLLADTDAHNMYTHTFTHTQTHTQAEAKAHLLEEYQAARGRCTSTLLADAVLEVRAKETSDGVEGLPSSDCLIWQVRLCVLIWQVRFCVKIKCVDVKMSVCVCWAVLCSIFEKEQTCNTHNT